MSDREKSCTCPKPELCKALGRHINAKLMRIWEGTDTRLSREQMQLLRDKWIRESPGRVATEQLLGLLPKNEVDRVISLAPIEQQSKKEGCIYFGEPTGETVSCPTCRGRVELKLFGCEVYGKCTMVKPVQGIACCNGTKSANGTLVACPSLSLEKEEEKPPDITVELKEIPKEEGMNGKPRAKALKWSYGVTTVKLRKDDLLPRTLKSLSNAGFPNPRLFVDGDTDWRAWKNHFTTLEITCRDKILTHGNWVLSAYELFIREPNADLYAIFQDDFITYKNLRSYLESCKYPDGNTSKAENVHRGYWNLYTFPENQKLIPMAGRTGRQAYGWFPSNQRGKGAVALVFNRECLLALLQSPHMMERPMSATRGWKAVDGGIVTGLRKAGWMEYVHNPSLVQHTGKVSSMRNKEHELAKSYQGEGYDALEILKGM